MFLALGGVDSYFMGPQHVYVEINICGTLSQAMGPQ